MAPPWVLTPVNRALSEIVGTIAGDQLLVFAQRSSAPAPVQKRSAAIIDPVVKVSDAITKTKVAKRVVD